MKRQKAGHIARAEAKQRKRREALYANIAAKRERKAAADAYARERDPGRR